MQNSSSKGPALTNSFRVFLQHLASRKEQPAIQAVVECIKVYKLEAESPLGNLKKRLERLEKVKNRRKVQQYNLLIKYFPNIYLFVTNEKWDIIKKVKIKWNRDIGDTSSQDVPVKQHI